VGLGVALRATPSRAGVQSGLLAPSGFRGKEVWLYESLKYPLLGELTALLANRAVARWSTTGGFMIRPWSVRRWLAAALRSDGRACRENRRAQYKLMRRLDWCLTEAAMERTARRHCSSGAAKTACGRFHGGALQPVSAELLRGNFRGLRTSAS